MPIINLITDPLDLTPENQSAGEGSHAWLCEVLFSTLTVQRTASNIADPDGGSTASELEWPVIGIVQDANKGLRQSKEFLDETLFDDDETYRFDCAFKLNPAYPDVHEASVQIELHNTSTAVRSRAFVVDLDDGVLGTTGGSPDLPNESISLENLGSGWYRLAIDFDYTFSIGTPDGCAVRLFPIGGNSSADKPSTFPQRVYVYNPRLFKLSDLTAPPEQTAATFDALKPIEYRDQLRALLPQGFAWTREPDAVISNLLLAWGSELARIENRGGDVLTESDPRTTLELLGEWEELLGLPDDCLATPPTDLDERRDAVVAKLTESGGQSIPFFTGLALALGITIEIEEHQPFIVELSGAGDSVELDEVVFKWTVHASINLTAEQRDLLECSFERIKPAHTAVFFSYDIDAYVEEPAVVGVVAPVFGLVFS